MVKTLTELFNNLSVADQPAVTPAGTYNGTIKSSPVQNISGPLNMAASASTTPSGTYQNFLMDEGLASFNATLGNPRVGFITNPTTLSQAFLGTPSTPQPEIKLSAGNASLASPFRNTGSTRVIG